MDGNWRLSRGHCVALALGYAVLMLYSSTLIGPFGIHFVYRDPAEALDALLSISFVANGSDQRADWMGNLIMLLPYGALLIGALWPKHPGLRPFAAFAAFLLAEATILAVKYCQLFFPPRTVTLNYVTAQTIGALAGIVGFILLRRAVLALGAAADKLAWLVLALRLYTVALVVFLLLPLDFALNADDLATAIERLPDTMFALPGGDRPMQVRVLLLAVSAAAFIPVGMLFSFVKAGHYRVGRSAGSVTVIGLFFTGALFALTALLISGYPMLAPIAYRTAGMAAGAAALNWLARRNAAPLQAMFRTAAPWLVLPYLAALLVVNQLASHHWLSLDEAIAQIPPRSMLPLYDYYIVSKAQAAKNLVGHILLFMPIGVLLWMRYGRPMPLAALLIAMPLSLGIEVARAFRPGLVGDVNDVFVAGVAAAAAAWLAPLAWSLLSALTNQSRPTRQWNNRTTPPPWRRPPEVEDY